MFLITQCPTFDDVLCESIPDRYLQQRIGVPQLHNQKLKNERWDIRESIWNNLVPKKS